MSGISRLWFCLKAVEKIRGFRFELDRIPVLEFRLLHITLESSPKVVVMTLFPLNDEADCLALQHENRVGFLSWTTNVRPQPREK
jgi:hypothetical protein